MFLKLCFLWSSYGAGIGAPNLSGQKSEPEPEQSKVVMVPHYFSSKKLLPTVFKLKSEDSKR
jgi:hypothetical protein